MISRENNEILKSLKDLGMHKSMNVDSETDVRRVPGGLIYTSTVTAGGYSSISGARPKAITSVFVPFDEIV